MTTACLGLVRQGFHVLCLVGFCYGSRLRSGVPTFIDGPAPRDLGSWSARGDQRVASSVVRGDSPPGTGVRLRGRGEPMRHPASEDARHRPAGMPERLSIDLRGLRRPELA